MAETEDYEETLSFVILSSDNRKLLLNDKPHWGVDIPRRVRNEKLGFNKRLELVDLIAKGCELFKLDYRNQENLHKCAREILDEMYERARAARKEKEAQGIARQQLREGQEGAGSWLNRQRAADKELDVIPLLTREVMNLSHFKSLSDTKEILWHHEGVYVPGGEERIHSLLDKLGGFEVKITTRREIIEYVRIKTMTDRSEFDKEVYLVNCKNCVEDLRTGRCFDHDPEKYLFTQQLPVFYKPNEFRTPRKILDFLYNVMHPSDVPLVLEFIGYCLIKHCRFQKALMCAGPPDSGKSSFLNLLTAFLGKSNVADQTMQQLTENRFATASLFGKLANIFADLSDNRLRDISMFKVLVSGDRISAERKFRADFTFEPYAKLIFSANLPPLPPQGITDESAFYKRWFIVSFNLRKTCLFCHKPIEIDPDLLSKLTSEQELSGLLYLAVKSAQRLLARGRFTKSPTIEAIQEEYEKKANPVKAWASARCILHMDYSTDKDALEADFEDYCKRKKLPGLNNRIEFGKELKRIYNVDGTKKLGSKGKQKPVWKGIALRKQLRESGQLDLDVWEDSDEIELEQELE